jgi:glutaredoxin
MRRRGLTTSLFDLLLPVRWRRRIGQRRKVTLYTKPGCRLCEVAKMRLARAQREIPFELEEIDITTDERIHEAYRLRIPVVAIDGIDKFEHRVVVQDLLREISISKP